MKDEKDIKCQQQTTTISQTNKKEIYAQAIRQFLRFGPEITKDRITPEADRIMDEFLKKIHSCSRWIKIFSNLFTKANTIAGLMIAIGKEATKEEIEKAYPKLQKNIWLPCYSATLSSYQAMISVYLI